MRPGPVEVEGPEDVISLSPGELEYLKLDLEIEMKKAAEKLEFERAVTLRDKIRELEGLR